MPVPITYLHVQLADRQRWVYQPAANHEVAWLAMNRGKIHTSGAVLKREMAVFTEGTGVIELVAEGNVEFVIGSAAKHPYPLITGHYSVHTNPAALARGERTIGDLEHTAAVDALHRQSEA